MTDKYDGFQSVMSQAERWAPLSAKGGFGFALAEVPKGIYCNAAGAVSLMGKDGVTVTFTVAAGQTLDFRPVQVISAGSTLTTAQIILLLD